MGVKQYIQDYDEKFPSAVGGSNTSGGPYGWADEIQPYLKSTQIYQCPSEPTAGQSDPTKPGYTDYYYNSELSNTGAAGSSSSDLSQGGVSEAALTFSSLTILNADGDGASFISDGRYRTNGHAVYASFDSANAAKPDRPGVGGGLVSNASIGQRHLEGTNLSFADGHVKWYKTTGAGTGTAQGNFYKCRTPFTTSQQSPTFAVN